MVEMTYTLLAYDESLNMLGVGVVSGSIAVGSRVPWGKGGLGVVATQGYTNPLLGKIILILLEKGYYAEEALRKALTMDPEPEYRQVAILSPRYGLAMYTGRMVSKAKKGMVGANCLGIGNLLSSERVIEVLVSTYETSRGSIEERILKSLQAASITGGDARGDKSSAILVFGNHPKYKDYDKLLDLRVDYSEDPVNNLINLYKTYKKS